MSLNKQKGNMYGFVTHTWNTIKGKCPHNCSYCYMKRFPQPELHFDEKELKTNLGEGNFIFVGSSCDMFANDISDEWIITTLDHCQKYDSNCYIFQSKNPKRYNEFEPYFPNQTTLLTTIETNKWNLLKRYSGGDLSAKSRAEGLQNWMIRFATEITIEPIMEFDLKYFINIIKLSECYKVNIGADSGNNNLPEPSKENILELISELEKFTIVYQKTNLKRLLEQQ